MNAVVEGRRIDTKSTAVPYTDDEECRRRIGAAIGSERLRHAILTTMGIDPGPFQIPVCTVPSDPPAPRKRDIIRIPTGRPHSPIADIQAAVAEYYDISPVHMTSARKDNRVAHPRQIAMYLASELTRFSLSNIGKHFGGRDHSTVIHAIRVVKGRTATDPKTFRDVAALREALAR